MRLGHRKLKKEELLKVGLHGEHKHIGKTHYVGPFFAF